MTCAEHEELLRISQERVKRLEAALLEVIHHTYHGDRAKDDEGYWCLAGLQAEMRAVLDGDREPRPPPPDALRPEGT